MARRTRLARTKSKKRDLAENQVPPYNMDDNAAKKLMMRLKRLSSIIIVAEAGVVESMAPR